MKEKEEEEEVVVVEEEGAADLEALPGQLAAVEVHEHVSERLHVVPTRLLDAEVRVDRRVTRRARQVLVFSTHTSRLAFKTQSPYATRDGGPREHSSRPAC